MEAKDVARQLVAWGRAGLIKLPPEQIYPGKARRVLHEQKLLAAFLRMCDDLARSLEPEFLILANRTETDLLGGECEFTIRVKVKREEVKPDAVIEGKP